MNSEEAKILRRRFLALTAGAPALLPALLPSSALGWQGAPSLTQADQGSEVDGEFIFSTGVRVVNVLATVRSKRGEVARDLQKEDFVLEEDGKQQEIRYFSKQSDLPLTIGLLIDVSGSQRNVLDEEKVASRGFLRKVLREDQDKGFVIAFAGPVSLEQDLTSSRTEMDKAIDSLEVPVPGQQPRRRFLTNDVGVAQFQRGGMGMPGGMGGGYAMGGTSLYDATYLAAEDVLKTVEGRKAVIILSDGEDSGSQLTVAGAIEAAQRAEVLIYTIRFADNIGGFGSGYGESGASILKRMSAETGGGYFEGKKRELDKTFLQIEDELRGQYSLGYQPPQNNASGFRKITLKTKEKGFKVQTRAGYYQGTRRSR